MRKIFAIFFLTIFLTTPALASPQKILGVEREQWDIVLADLKRTPPENFLDLILANEKPLRQKREADHFERLDGERRKRANPLWSKKRKYRYMTSLDLSKTDFTRAIGIVRDLQERITDEEIAAYLPYIALCLCEGMNVSDIRFYIDRDIFLGTPVDLSVERLYRELKIELGEI